MIKKEQLIQNLYTITLENEELDGGTFVQSTPIYKELVALLSPVKPIEKFASDYFPFELALKALAVEFCRGDNHGFYCADSYMNLIDSNISNTNLEDLVNLLKQLMRLENFEEDDLDCNYETGRVADKKSGQMLTADNIQNLIKSVLELLLQIQIERIKIHLSEKQSRNKIIRMLAGSDKDELLETAEFRFDKILSL